MYTKTTSCFVDIARCFVHFTLTLQKTIDFVHI